LCGVDMNSCKIIWRLVVYKIVLFPYTSFKGCYLLALLLNYAFSSSTYINFLNFKKKRGCWNPHFSDTLWVKNL
jgi:hypothetical protein